MISPSCQPNALQIASEVEKPGASAPGF